MGSNGIPHHPFDLSSPLWPRSNNCRLTYDRTLPMAERHEWYIGDIPKAARRWDEFENKRWLRGPRTVVNRFGVSSSGKH